MASQRPTDGQRPTALRRSVAELTREWRASVRRSGEFDALLVRGTPLNHRRHLTRLFLLPTIGFLRRILTGRPVAFVRAISRRTRQPRGSPGS